jgi:hypothetical protein
MVEPTFLIIPRNDGVAVSIDGTIHLKQMDATQMLNLALRCLNAGLEMKREEEKAAKDCEGQSPISLREVSEGL